MRRSTWLAALLLAAMFWGGESQQVNCPYSPAIWNLTAASPAVIPVGADCSTLTLYTVFEYWTPELNSSTLSSSSGINPDPNANAKFPTPRDAAGNALQAPGVSCQWFSQNLGAFPAPTTAPPNVTADRTCGSLNTNAATLPTGPVVLNSTADSSAQCCKLCTNTIACKQWAYAANQTTANTTCLLYGSVTPYNTSAPLLYSVGYSGGWGSGFVSCNGNNIGDIRSVGFTFSGNYTQLCANGTTPPVAPPDATLTITVPAPADAPVAAVSNVTVVDVCANATSVTGTFFYSGSNIAGQTTFAVTLNGGACTPGAGSITGNTLGQTVPFTCTVPAVAAGALNVSVTATYSGSQVTGGCAGNKTASAAGTGTATPAPSATFGASPVGSTVCTGNGQIVVDYVYSSSAANTTFSATSNPTSSCTVTPASIIGGSTNQTIRVVCTKAAPGFQAGIAVVNLVASYAGSAPCTTSATTSQSANVSIVNAESGVSLVPGSSPSKCAPTNTVAASFTFNATNVGNIVFAATSPGLSCVAVPSISAGSTTPTSVPVGVTCSSTTPLAAGSYPITLVASWAGQGPCAGGSYTAITSVTIEPTPSVDIAPIGGAPTTVCFRAQNVVQDFRVTVANGASNTALTAQLAGLFSCSVTPSTVASNGTVTVRCDNPAGFPSGKHNLTITALASGPAGPCAGPVGPKTTYTTITVLPAPTLAITPVRVDEPLCAGDASVTVTWGYAIAGTVGTPLVTATSVVATNGVTCVLSAPAGNTTRGTVTAVCSNLPTTDASLDITLTMTVTEPGCGTVTGASTNTYTIACCLYNSTAYAKAFDNNPNPPFCHKHQRPNNVQTRNCPFYYGWFNQGPTTSDVANVDSVSKLVALADPSAPGCAEVTTVADITAVCEGVLGLPGTGATPQAPPSRGDNSLTVTVIGFKYSSVRTFVYAGCPKPRNGDIPLSNATCANTATTWKPFNWAHYSPQTIIDVPSGRAFGLQFKIPISRTGGCTCANLYWTVVQTGTFKGVPCPAP